MSGRAAGQLGVVLPVGPLPLVAEFRAERTTNPQQPVSGRAAGQLGVVLPVGPLPLVAEFRAERTTNHWITDS